MGYVARVRTPCISGATKIFSSTFFSFEKRELIMSFKTFTLVVPASNDDVAKLMQVILCAVGDLQERVGLRFGTSRLLARDEREREEHSNTVSVREALFTLAAALRPGDDEE